jgi:hypothetical protein
MFFLSCQSSTTARIATSAPSTKCQSLSSPTAPYPNTKGEAISHSPAAPLVASSRRQAAAPYGAAAHSSNAMTKSHRIGPDAVHSTNHRQHGGFDRWHRNTRKRRGRAGRPAIDEEYFHHLHDDLDELQGKLGAPRQQT